MAYGLHLSATPVLVGLRLVYTTCTTVVGLGQALRVYMYGRPAA